MEKSRRESYFKPGGRPTGLKAKKAEATFSSTAASSSFKIYIFGFECVHA
jgi:hypothetical protein